MPPSARPPRIGSQRLPVWAAAGCVPCCAGAACWAGFAGVCAGGAVTLRCAPRLRPPPMRRASTSVATSAPPSARIPLKRSHLPIGSTSEPVIVLSNADPSVDCNHAGRKVKHFDLRQAGLAHHRGERRLVRMLADRLGEVAVGRSVPGHFVAQPRQYLERVPV